jgi:hypothetical protein
MANGSGIHGPPLVDFGLISQLPDSWEIGQERARQNRLRQLLQQSGTTDYNQMVRLAMQAGALNQIDPFARLGLSAATQAETRRHNIATENKPQYFHVEDPTTNELNLYEVDPRTGIAKKLPIQGGPGAATLSPGATVRPGWSTTVPGGEGGGPLSPPAATPGGGGPLSPTPMGPAQSFAPSIPQAPAQLPMPAPAGAPGNLADVLAPVPMAGQLIPGVGAPPPPPPPPAAAGMVPGSMGPGAPLPPSVAPPGPPVAPPAGPPIAPAPGPPPSGFATLPDARALPAAAMAAPPARPMQLAMAQAGAGGPALGPGGILPTRQPMQVAQLGPSELPFAQSTGIGVDPRTPGDVMKGAPEVPVRSAYPPADATRFGRNFGVLDELARTRGERYARMVQMAGDYELDPLGRGFPQKLRFPITTDAKAYNPNYREDLYSTYQKNMQAYGPNGRAGMATRSFSVAMNHLETYLELARALNNGDLQAANAARAKIGTWRGKEEPVNLKAAGELVSAEIAKAIVGGQNALADREGIREQMTNSLSPAQALGVATTYQKLLAGQILEFRRTYPELTNRDQREFDRLLSPDALRIFRKYGSGEAATMPNVPPTAIDDVRRNPALRGDFIRKYGQQQFDDIFSSTPAPGRRSGRQ